MIANIFQIRGPDFHTLTENMRVKSLQTSYLCKLVKSNHFQGSRNQRGKIRKILKFSINVFLLINFIRKKMKIVLFQFRYLKCQQNPEVPKIPIFSQFFPSFPGVENIVWAMQKISRIFCKSSTQGLFVFSREKSKIAVFCFQP